MPTIRVNPEQLREGGNLLEHQASALQVISSIYRGALFARRINPEYDDHSFRNSAGCSTI